MEAHGVVGKLRWAYRSETGPTRESNEDCVGAFVPTVPDDAWDRGPLFAVADGMGGHAAGEVASRIAVAVALGAWTTESPQPPVPWLRRTVREANAAVFDAALEPDRHGMGTTFTAVTLMEHEVVIAHVGDSRAYLVRAGECEQLTVDHSRVGEMVRMRLLTPEQAAQHPARSQLTRALGSEPTVQIDVVRRTVGRGDVLVLCSDGLWDLVSRAEIAAAAVAEADAAAPTAETVTADLVGLAVAREAPDNVTAIVVQMTSDLPIPSSGGRRRRLFRGRS